MDDEPTTIVPIVSSDGEQIFRVEARSFGGREQVSALEGISEDELRKPIEAIANTLAGVLQKVSPTKATAEFAVEIGLEAGKLTALLCKGSGKANIKVTLEWSGSSSSNRG